jgi:multiple sugar transport system permease protein
MNSSNTDVATASFRMRSSRLPGGRARSRRDAGRNVFGYTLLAPGVLGFLAVGGTALVWVFWLSLHTINSLSQKQRFVGFDNYVRILHDPDMKTIFPNTALFVLVLSVLGTVVALALAVMLNQKVRGINIFRSAIFVPALVTMVAWALVWHFIVQPKGALDAAFDIFGLGPYPWLRGGPLTLVVFAVIQMTKNVGVNVIIILAALQAVPNELIEAARIDGAGAWSRFRHIVVPQISPTILMVFMLTVTGSFKVFEIVLLLTDGGPGVESSVLSFAIYQQAFELNDIGYASALAVVLFVFVLVLTGVIWQLRKRFVYHESD